MKSIDKTLEYHELLMVYDNIPQIENENLPQGFHFEFWKSIDDLNDWISIHIETGEFTSRARAEKTFYDFYDDFINELDKRCFFIIDSETGEKVATSTVSPSDEYGYKCVVDWLGVKRAYQGKKLGKSLILKTLKCARGLGYDKILLHTQTHTWLAAKIYLDLGFEPFNIDLDLKGWQILKTITNHVKLQNIISIRNEDMYMKEALNIVNFLNEKYKNYTYQIWHKNGMNDVYVRENNIVYEYKYFDCGKRLELVKSYKD